jgi:carboxyl-terminal processing protease
VDAQRAAGVEAAPSCEGCEANRQLLEQAFQVVCNEYFDRGGRFSQAAFADRLLGALQASGGALRTREEAYAAAEGLVASLGDRYSAFLRPPAFRGALRRPLPAERAYLAAQLVGVGVELGGPAPGGGRAVEAPLAGSAAEEAGVQRGDALLAVGASLRAGGAAVFAVPSSWRP